MEIAGFLQGGKIFVGKKEKDKITHISLYEPINEKMYYIGITVGFNEISNKAIVIDELSDVIRNLFIVEYSFLKTKGEK